MLDQNAAEQGRSSMIDVTIITSLALSIVIIFCSCCIPPSQESKRDRKEGIQQYHKRSLRILLPERLFVAARHAVRSECGERLQLSRREPALFLQEEVVPCVTRVVLSDRKLFSSLVSTCY